MTSESKHRYLSYAVVLLLSAVTACKDRTDDLLICNCHDPIFGYSTEKFCDEYAHPDSYRPIHGNICNAHCDSGNGDFIELKEDGCKKGFAWWLRSLVEANTDDATAYASEQEWGLSAIAVRSPDSPYRGRLVESGAETSRIRIKKGQPPFLSGDPWVHVRGNASLAGELCPYGSCAVTLEWLEVEAKTSFNVIGSGDSISGFSLTNYGPWVGYKNSDGTFYFQQSASISAGAVVNGRSVAANVRASSDDSLDNIIRGRIDWSSGTPIMTINGTFRDASYAIELDLAFNLNDAGPAASIAMGGSTQCPPGTAIEVYEGFASSLDYASSQLQMKWYDQNGTLLGSGRCLKLTDSACFAGRGPVVLVVTDPAGRSSTAQYNGDPVLGIPRAYENFGSAVAVGDFNGDGFGDVLAGVPGDKVDGHAGAEQGLCPGYCPPDGWNYCEPAGVGGGGAVLAMYGSSTGITARKGQFLSQNSPGVPGASEVDDLFGWALAVGDFDGDGFSDVAAGAPGENHAGGASDGPYEGMVTVHYGSRFGLMPDSNHTDSAAHNVFNQGRNGLAGGPEAYDMFGISLASGDFNGDGADDLAIGAPGENSYGGVVHIIYGVKGQGLTAAGNVLLWQRDVGWADEPSDRFGGALAAGDLNNDGYDELAVASVTENDGVGAVVVLYGSSTGPRRDTAGRWNLVATGEYAGQFGASLAIADFTGDKYGDLAIGAPMANSSTGAVVIVSGTAGKLNTSSLTVLAPGRSSPWGTLPAATSGAQFGKSLAAGYYDGDHKADLAIGMPSMAVGGVAGSGTAVVLKSNSSSRVSFFDSGSIEVWDSFGQSLAMGDLDRNGRADVVFGVPGQRVRNQAGAGKIAVQMTPDVYGRGGKFVSFSQDTVTLPPPPREFIQPPVVH